MPSSARCCRSAPRCADCPARVTVSRRHESVTAALVAEVLGGGMRRELPAPVIATLATLEQARRAPSLAPR